MQMTIEKAGYQGAAPQIDYLGVGIGKVSHLCVGTDGEYPAILPDRYRFGADVLGHRQ